MKPTGYYNEQKATDERLAAFLKKIGKRRRDGEHWAKGRQGQGIAISKELKKHGLGSKWSGFVKDFDYGRRITEGRISKERHAWQEREAVRMALRHPFKAADKYGIPAEEVAPVAPREPRAPRKPAEPLPRANIRPADIRLQDWSFSPGMKALLLHWEVKDGEDLSIRTTTHRLEPQVYAYEQAFDKEGNPVQRRRLVSGDFRDGALSKGARVRVIEEARTELAAALPELCLERYKDTLATMDYIMR